MIYRTRTEHALHKSGHPVAHDLNDRECGFRVSSDRIALGSLEVVAWAERPTVEPWELDAMTEPGQAAERRRVRWSSRLGVSYWGKSVVVS